MVLQSLWSSSLFLLRSLINCNSYRKTSIKLFFVFLQLLQLFSGSYNKMHISACLFNAIGNTAIFLSSTNYVTSLLIAYGHDLPKFDNSVFYAQLGGIFFGIFRSERSLAGYIYYIFRFLAFSGCF